MKKKKWFLYLGIILTVLIVGIGGDYFVSHPKESAQTKATKVSSRVQKSSNDVRKKEISSKSTNKRIEASYSNASSTLLESKKATQNIATERTTTQTEKNNLTDDLKVINQTASAEEVYVKYPYGRQMDFERATSEKLKALEKQYTLKGMTNLKDDYDGQIKSVIIFE